MKILINIPEEIAVKALEAEKTVEEYILDCVTLIGCQNSIALKMDEEYMKENPIPKSNYSETPTEEDCVAKFKKHGKFKGEYTEDNVWVPSEEKPKETMVTCSNCTCTKTIELKHKLSNT